MHDYGIAALRALDDDELYLLVLDMELVLEYLREGADIAELGFERRM